MVIITDAGDVVGGTLSINAVDTSSGALTTTAALQASAFVSRITLFRNWVYQQVGCIRSWLGWVDILNYNPYADGVDGTRDALDRYFKPNLTTVKSIAAAAAAEAPTQVPLLIWPLALWLQLLTII